MKALIKFVAVADRIVDALVRYFTYLAAAILLLMALSISLDVALRYSIKLPLKWVFEATEYSLLFITFLAATWVLKKDGHVKLDLALNALGRKAQSRVNVLTALVMAGVALVIFWTSASYTIYLFQNDITIVKYYTIPQFAVFIIIPIGFLMLFIQSLKRAYQFYREK